MPGDERGTGNRCPTEEGTHGYLDQTGKMVVEMRQWDKRWTEGKNWMGRVSGK